MTVVLAAVFLGYLVCSAFTWYAWDPLYQFLNWVRDYIVFVCMLVILLGWVAISYSFIARPMRLVDTLAAAAEQLAGNGPCGTPGLPGRQNSGKTTWWSIWPMI